MIIIPPGDGFKWERFKRKEAELLLKRDEAKGKGGTDELAKINDELYEHTRAWMEQLMIWGGEDKRSPMLNDVYWKIREALKNGTDLPDTKTWK